MLVCNVSLRPARTGISAGLAEGASATDATATGNIVFATLVDDPASVRDRVDAYSGEIMLEAASANAAVNAGLTYAARVDEAVTAAVALDGDVPSVLAGAMVEAATAVDHPNATTVAAAAKTTTGTMAVGPLLVIDATFAATSLTIIDVGRP